jgi:hypothetical protein
MPAPIHAAAGQHDALACPSCGTTIAEDDVHPRNGTALCPVCGARATRADLVAAASARPSHTACPPPGAWRIQDPDGVRIGATLRGRLAAFYIPFALLWTGLFLGLTGLILWKKGPDPVLIGALVFGCAISLVLVVPALLTVAGRQEVTIGPNKARIFIGVGPLGRTRRFDPDKVKELREVETDMELNGRRVKAIRLRAPSTIDFGALMSHPRRRWMLAALRAELLKTTDP